MVIGSRYHWKKKGWTVRVIHAPIVAIWLLSLKYQSWGTWRTSRVQARRLHTVLAMPCLWQGGIHSLQGLPSILLIKQWLCAQPTEGRKNATQRDKNVKCLAIWGGRVPNNDSSVIIEEQSFFSLLSHPKNSGCWGGDRCEHWSLHVALWQRSHPLILCVTRNAHREILNPHGGNSCNSNTLI